MVVAGSRVFVVSRGFSSQWYRYKTRWRTWKLPTIYSGTNACLVLAHCCCWRCCCDVVLFCGFSSLKKSDIRVSLINFQTSQFHATDSQVDNIHELQWITNYTHTHMHISHFISFSVAFCSRTRSSYYGIFKSTQVLKLFLISLASITIISGCVCMCVCFMSGVILMAQTMLDYSN